MTIAVLAVLVPAGLSAQAAARPAQVPRWEVGPYVGVSWHSPVGTHLGVIPDRKHLLVGVQVTANFIRSGRWALGYSPEVVPLFLVSNNPTYRTIRVPQAPPYTIEDGRGLVAGVAVAPVALQAQVSMTARWRAYLGGAAGAVWFTRQVPVAYSSAFNYTLEASGGVRWQVREREALRIGYKFHHLSNAYTAPSNPGLDAAVIQIGYERVWR